MADVDIRIRTIDQTGGGIRSIENKLKGMLSTFTAVTAGATVMAGVFKKAFDFAEQGAQIGFIEQKFGRLAESIGSDSQSILAALTEVSRGTLTTAQMMDQASQIISLGLADNQEDVVRLASLVTNLGWDMQQVILTFANDSKMRLDALGLSVEDVTRRAREFEEAGYDASRAFDMAVLAAGEEKLRLVGSAADSSVGAFLRFRTAIQETTDKGKVWLAEGLTPIVMLLNDDYGDAVDAAVAKNLELAGSFEELGRAQYLQALTEQLIKLRETGEGAGAWLTGTQDEMIQGQIELTRAIAASSVSFEDFKENIRGVVATEGIGGLTNDTQELALVYTAFNARVLENAEAFYLAAKAGSTLGNAYDYLIDRAVALSAQQAEGARLSSGAYDFMIDRSIQLNATMETYGEHLANARQKQEELAEGRRLMDALAESERRLAAQAGEYFVQAMNAGRGAGFFDQRLEDLGRQYVQINGRSEQQNEDLEAITDAYERATGTLHEYEIGLRGAGMTEEERAEAMGKLSDEAARLQGLMQPLVDITGEWAAVNVTASINQEAVNSALMRAVEAAGAAPEKIAALGVALGEYSPQAAEAALQSAAIQAKIDELAAAYAGGKIKVGEMRTELMLFIADLTAVQEPTGAAAEAVGRIGRNMDELKGATDRAADALKNFPKTVTVDFTYNIPDVPNLPGGSGVGMPRTGGGGTGEWTPPDPDRHRAAGGPVRAGVAYMVGERGPEMFVPPIGGTVVPNGGMGGITIQQLIINAGSESNGRALARDFANELERQARLKRISGAGYMGAN